MHIRIFTSPRRSIQPRCAKPHSQQDVTTASFTKPFFTNQCSIKQRGRARQFVIGGLALASLQSTFALIPKAEAFTAFETPTDSLLISGRIAYDYQWNRSGTTDDRFGNGGTRLNVAYQHKLSNGWILTGRWEEALDPLYTTHSGDAHFNRQRFVGVTFPEYGTLSFGRQNSLLYDFVDVYTDQPYFYGDYSEMSWSGSDLNGSVMRPSSTLKYVVTKGKWTLGAMYGWSRGTLHDHDITGADGEPQRIQYGSKRKDFVEVGAKFKPSHDVTLSAVYHYAHIKSLENNASYPTPNANAWDLGASWTPGNWYLAAVGGRSRNVVAHNAVNNHYGTYAQYTFPAVWGDGNDLLVYGLYDLRTDQRSAANKDRRVIGTAARLFHRQFIVALEHVWNKDKNSQGDHIYHHDSTVLLARYNF